MIPKLLIAWCLMALCVAVHAIGLTMALRRLQRHPASRTGAFLPAVWMLIGVAGWMILLHMIEIALWAFFYTWNECLPDLQSAIYFSAVTYTTTSYGDLVLPKEWRLLGAVEALTGILMCGLSTGYFFSVLGRMFQTNKNDVSSASSTFTQSCEAHVPVGS